MGTLAILALILVPVYLLLNQYWRSLVTLLAVYGVLALAFLRLERHIRRVMRRAPAEIPPWHTIPRHPSPPPLQPVISFSVSEAIQYVVKDPHYMQDVLKPRLHQLLTYRLSGTPDLSLDALGTAQRAALDPRVVAFLQGREETGLWARYRYRHQRLLNVLATLRQIESL